MQKCKILNYIVFVNKNFKNYKLSFFRKIFKICCHFIISYKTNYKVFMNEFYTVQ